MMSERLRSRDPKSNTTKSYTMFFEDENKYNSVNSSSNSGNNNNSDNNNLKKFLKKQMNLNNNSGSSGNINNSYVGGIGDMDNDEKINREQFFENFQTEQNLAVMENGRKRKYDKIKEEENNGSNSNNNNNNNNNNCSGNELDEDNQKQQQTNINNENQHTNDELNENLNERNFNEENLNENTDENDAKKTKLDNNSYHSNNNNNIESQALINRNLQRLLHHQQHEEDEEDVDNDLESVPTNDNLQPIKSQNDNINDTINVPTTTNISSMSTNNYNNAALSNSAYLESLEIIKKIKYDDTRELMYQVYQPWVLQTYGDSTKTKTITAKKQERIIKTLTGQETNNPDSSKFRFWVKSKGFTTEKPKEFKEIEIDRSNLSNEQRLDDKNVCLLYVPNFSKDSTAQPYRKVAVVEYFFDIIFEVHVGLGGRSGRHAGQKRTYRTISESYAFLPREAVTKFLSGCILCRKFPIRTFTTFTSKFLEEQLTDSSTEFVENSPKSELNGNMENLNNNNNINNNNEDKKFQEIDNKILNNDNNNSCNNNNNGNNNNNTASTSKDNDDGVKLSVDWEEEINLETSKSNEKKFVSNINNINSKIEHDLLNELNENFFLSASSAAAAAASASDDKNCIKNITITNELVTYYHLLKQFYEQQHHMKVNPMPATQTSSSSVSSSTVATTNITTKTENEVVNLVQQQQNLRQIRLPQKNLMEDYKNLPLIMSTLSQSFKQNDLLLQVQQQSQQVAQSSILPNSQSLIDLTITKSPSPQPVELKSPQLSPKPDQPISNININMNNFDNLSINVSTNIDKNKVKILCNTTPPKKRYNNFFTTATPTPLTPTIASTISSPSTSSVSSTLSSTLSSASILNDNINFMNNILLNNTTNNNNSNNNSGGSSDNTASNNSNSLIFKQKNEKIENIIKKCEMKNQQHNSNNSNNNNNNSGNNNNNNVFQINPITSTYLNMTRSMGLSDDDALKFDELVSQLTFPSYLRKFLIDLILDIGNGNFKAFLVK